MSSSATSAPPPVRRASRDLPGGQHEPEAETRRAAARKAADNEAGHATVVPTATVAELVAAANANLESTDFRVLQDPDGQHVAIVVNRQDPGTAVRHLDAAALRDLAVGVGPRGTGIVLDLEA